MPALISVAPFAGSWTLNGYAQTLKNIKGYRRELRPALRQVLRYVAKDVVMERIKDQMPYWSGRAMAGWGIYRKSALANRGRTKTLKGSSRIIRNQLKAAESEEFSYDGDTSSSRFLRNLNASSPADAIWIDKSYGRGANDLSITQGTSIGYVRQLEQGASTKNPGGFIARNTEDGRIILKREAKKAINAILNSRNAAPYKMRTTATVKRNIMGKIVG